MLQTKRAAHFNAKNRRIHKKTHITETEQTNLNSNTFFAVSMFKMKSVHMILWSNVLIC